MTDDQIVATAQFRILAANCIEQLPKNEQLVLSLYYFDRLEVEEIAHVLQMAQVEVTWFLAKGINAVYACKSLSQLRRSKPC